jgi:NADH-quinone oxidoreductase subunit J
MLFYCFAAMAILASLMMILAYNPVRAVLSMVLAFVSMAGIWLLLEDEFLAIALILVYVGAVMVLFLFVVMMLDIEMPAIKRTLGRQLPLGIILFGIMYALLRQGLIDFSSLGIHEPGPLPRDYSNITALGEVLYTEYVFPFEMAGVILLVAMIAAIGLTYRGRRSLSQRVAEQVKVTKKDRLKIIKRLGV